MLSDRINAIQSSPTLQVTAKAIQLKRQGFPVISLSAGEPDFPTPQHIKEAGVKAIFDNQTRYTEVQGILPLRQAICDKLQRDHGLSYSPDQINVGCGAKQVIFNLMGVVLNPGDEVLIPAPYWVSYPDMAMLFGGVPVTISSTLEARYKITPEALRAAITPRSRLLILNSPSNPTGMAYTLEELKALAEVVLPYPDLLICSDDIYEKILWQGTFANIVMAEPALKDRTIVVNGFSKAYAMTGWRLGYAAGALSLIQAINKLQSQSTSNACTPSQYAGLAALQGDQSCLKPMVAAFKERHDGIVQEVNQIPGMKMLPADGAFYAFIDVSEAMAASGLTDDIAFSNLLLEQAHVAGVPGSAFGMPQHIRFSYATSMEEIKEALARLRQALGRSS